MIDFEESRDKAWGKINLTYSLSKLDDIEIRRQKFKDAAEVWKIQTELFLPDDSIRMIELMCVFPEEFPLKVPRFYLSEKDYNWIKYIPHLNTNRLVCLFDDESITVDPENPSGIIETCIQKAKAILQDGVNRKNNADFNEEFLAYWEDEYNQHDEVIAALSIENSTTEIRPENLKLLYLKKDYHGYHYILTGKNEESSNFKSFLQDININYEEQDIFFLGNLRNLSPPFNCDNDKVYNTIKSCKPELVTSFEKFINNKVYPKVVVFYVEVLGRTLFFGWLISFLKLWQKGFRSGYFSPLKTFTTFQKHTPVSRLAFQELTLERLQNRTDGPGIKNVGYHLTVAGLGSVGSNILHYLFTSDLKKLILIDPEILTVANINRHLLGMTFVNNSKADALQFFFRSKNPLLSVECYKTSIITLIKEKIDLFNSADFNFVAIGKENIERYIVDCLNTRVLLKPTFIIWVEPYLCGGHCLFICPDHQLDYLSLQSDNYYKYNMINKEEYLDCNRVLLFREAGCQSSYIPYGQKTIMLFLAALTPAIFNVMETKPHGNLRFTWKGNKKIFEELKLKPSKEADNIMFEDLKVCKL